MTAWHFLEQLPESIGAISWVWEDELKEDYPAFKKLCLSPYSERLVEWYECPNGCPCWHKVHLTHEFRHTPIEDRPQLLDCVVAVGACDCTPRRCPDLQLTLRQITPLLLNWGMLAREVARAFNLNYRFSDTALQNTVGIGSWCDTVPALLTIQNEPLEMYDVISELHARLDKPFLLFAPTAHLVDFRAQELIAMCKVGFFPLNTNTTLTAAGNLIPIIDPGKLFSPWTPQPKETDQSVAERAFAIIKAMGSNNSLPPPHPLTVFELYCVENLSARQIAKNLNCAKTTVLRRLDFIRQKTGLSPDRLRAFSPHLAENEVADSRASHIHRKRLIDDEQDNDNP